MCVGCVCVGVLLALSKAILAASEFEVLDILLAPSASESDSFFEPPATPPAALLKASVIAFDPPLSDFIAFRLVALSIASAFRFDSRRLFVVVGAGGEDGVLADAAGMLETGAAPAVPFDTPRSFAALSRARTSLLRLEPGAMTRGPAAVAQAGWMMKNEHGCKSSVRSVEARTATTS